MRVEGGSQNLSRISGQYVYPAPRYNREPVGAVSSVRPDPEMMRKAEEVAREWSQREMDPVQRPDRFEGAPLYRSNAPQYGSSNYTVGQYLNILI